jgi:hypothetical protein
MSAGRKVTGTRCDWGTPSFIVAVVHKFLGEIALDPCSNAYSIVNAKTRYIHPQDGLKEDWSFPSIFVNPPYGKDPTRSTSIANWLERCHTSSNQGSEVIALIPVATNTGHWKKFVYPSVKALCFLKDTRLKFLEKGESKGKGAPMACCLLYWGEKSLTHFQEVFSPLGEVVYLRSH